MSTFRPDSFMQAEAAINRIVLEATREVERFETRVSDISFIASTLANMSQAEPVGWLGVVQYVDAQALANPADPAWTDLKARLDKIVADFTAARTRVDQAVTALSGI